MLAGHTYRVDFGQEQTVKLSAISETNF